MSSDSKSTAYRLTFEDAVDVWIRSWRGEFQHRIASAYDVNPGRVSEVLKERTHIGSRRAALAKFKGAA